MWWLPIKSPFSKWLRNKDLRIKGTKHEYDIPFMIISNISRIQIHIKTLSSSFRLANNNTQNYENGINTSILTYVKLDLVLQSSCDRTAESQYSNYKEMLQRSKRSRLQNVWRRKHWEIGFSSYAGSSKRYQTFSLRILGIWRRASINGHSYAN